MSEDKRYPADQENPFAEDKPDPDLAPLRIDVSISIAAAATLGAAASEVVDQWPGLYLPVWLALAVVVMLLVRWTRKR